MKTAVEWLAFNLDIVWEEKIIDLVEQAKEMEKQQIIDAYQENMMSFTDGEQYYNGKFKSE
jgi:hypothetical protein